MKRRLYGVLQHYDAGWSDLDGNIRLVDLVGEDSLLALTKIRNRSANVAVPRSGRVYDWV
jgi:hypothetical protein